VIFADIAVKVENIGLNPGPSLPYVAKDDRKQFQYLNVA